MECTYTCPQCGHARYDDDDDDVRLIFTQGCLRKRRTSRILVVSQVRAFSFSEKRFLPSVPAQIHSRLLSSLLLRISRLSELRHKFLRFLFKTLVLVLPPRGLSTRQGLSVQIAKNQYTGRSRKWRERRSPKKVPVLSVSCFFSLVVFLLFLARTRRGTSPNPHSFFLRSLRELSVSQSLGLLCWSFLTKRTK